MYFRARYYDSLLGRFLSADTLVPEPGYPQAFNRYAFVYNNPLKYTDPSGHCPKPPKEYGNVICVAGFIPVARSAVPDVQAFIMGMLGLGSEIRFFFEGDDRSFSYDSSKDAYGTGGSRFWIWINADTGEILNPGGKASVHETCRVNGACTEPRDDYNRITPVMNDDGTISLDIRIVCSDNSIYCVNGTNDVNASLTFVRNDKGGYDAQVSADSFPNLEAYYWSSGQLRQTVLQVQNFSSTEIRSGTGYWWTGLGLIGLGKVDETFSNPLIRRFRPSR
jgi:hypothetical protein